MNAPTPGRVLARWTARPRPEAGSVCDECATVLDDIQCGTCGQLAGRPVGMLATVVDTPAGTRLVIAQRTEDGWTPVRTVPATEDNVRALARPGATGPSPVASSGGLW